MIKSLNYHSVLFFLPTHSSNVENKYAFGDVTRKFTSRAICVIRYATPKQSNPFNILALLFKPHLPVKWRIKKLFKLVTE